MMVSDLTFRSGTYFVDLYPIETEEQYKKIVDIICGELSGEIIESLDGPGFDFTKIRLDGEEVKIAFSAIEGVYVEGGKEPLLAIRRFVLTLLADG